MRTVNTRSPWPFAGAILLALALAASSPRGLLAQAATQGQWRTLANQTPINPIHVALMNNGDVLIVAGSGNVATETNFQAAVWDSGSQTFLTRALAWDMFCNGMVVLHDGRVLINGGNLQYDPFFGEPRNAVFDPATGLFTDIQNMAHGRWYPTVTTLGDGRVMTFSGLLETGGTNTAVEIYTVGSGWSPEYPAGWTPPLYPRIVRCGKSPITRSPMRRGHGGTGTRPTAPKSRRSFGSCRIPTPSDPPVWNQVLLISCLEPCPPDLLFRRACRLHFDTPQLFPIRQNRADSGVRGSEGCRNSRIPGTSVCVESPFGHPGDSKPS